jgi:hypothetical protein
VGVGVGVALVTALGLLSLRTAGRLSLDDETAASTSMSVLSPNTGRGVAGAELRLAGILAT